MPLKDEPFHTQVGCETRGDRRAENGKGKLMGEAASSGRPGKQGPCAKAHQVPRDLLAPRPAS